MRKRPINQLKFGAVLSYFSLAMGVVVSLVYTPIMLRQLGESEFGVYNTVLPIVSYLNLLSFGLGSAYTRFYSRFKVAEDREGMARLNGLFLTIYAILGAVVLTLGCIIAAGMPQLLQNSALTASEISLARTLMYILSFNAAVAFPISVFESHVMVNEQYLFQKIVAIGKTVLNPLIMIPLLLIGFRSVMMVSLTLFFTLLSGVLNIAYCLKKLKMPFIFGKFDRSLLKEMFGYTFYIFIGILVDQINWSMDRLILTSVGSVSISIYTIGSQLEQYYTSMSTTFSGLLTPRVHRMVSAGRSNEELSALFIRVGRIQFLLMSMILLGFVAVGLPFTVSWGGGEAYEMSYLIALALFIPALFPAIQNLGIEIQRAKNMHRFRSFVYLGVALGNLALSIPLCRLFAHIGEQAMGARYGSEYAGIFAGLGCAVGTALAVLIGNVLLMNWYYHKHIGLDIPAFWRSILRMVPGMLPPAAAAVAIFLWAPMQYSYFHAVVWGVVFIAVYLPSVWLFSMNDEEKDLVRRPLRKLLGKE